MAMMCVVCVVRHEGTDLYSAFHARRYVPAAKMPTLPKEAAREDLELYSVNTERGDIRDAPERKPLEKVDAWLLGLGDVRRVL